MTKLPKVEDMTFEEAFIALSQTLEMLEAGDLPLAESISLYEHGMALAAHCNVHLDQAELKIKTVSPDGELEEV